MSTITFVSTQDFTKALNEELTKDQLITEAKVRDGLPDERDSLDLDWQSISIIVATIRAGIDAIRLAAAIYRAAQRSHADKVIIKTPQGPTEIPLVNTDEAKIKDKLNETVPFLK